MFRSVRVLVGIAGIAMSAAASAVTIDFEDSGPISPVFTPIGSHYQDLGVVFGPAWTNYMYDSFYPARSGKLSALIQTTFAGGRIDFLTPVANVSAYFNVYAYPLTWSAYDTANNLLGSVVLGNTSQPTPGGMQLYALAFENISYLTLSGAQTNYFNMDDFSFAATQVPEPETLALLALGILGFAVRARKR